MHGQQPAGLRPQAFAGLRPVDPREISPGFIAPGPGFVHPLPLEGIRGFFGEAFHVRPREAPPARFGGRLRIGCNHHPQLFPRLQREIAPPGTRGQPVLVRHGTRQRGFPPPEILRHIPGFERRRPERQSGFRHGEQRFIVHPQLLPPGLVGGGLQLVDRRQPAARMHGRQPHRPHHPAQPAGLHHDRIVRQLVLHARHRRRRARTRQRPDPQRQPRVHTPHGLRHRRAVAPEPVLHAGGLMRRKHLAVHDQQRRQRGAARLRRKHAPLVQAALRIPRLRTANRRPVGLALPEHIRIHPFRSMRRRQLVQRPRPRRPLAAPQRDARHFEAPVRARAARKRQPHKLRRPDRFVHHHVEIARPRLDAAHRGPVRAVRRNFHHHIGGKPVRAPVHAHAAHRLGTAQIQFHCCRRMPGLPGGGRVAVQQRRRPGIRRAIHPRLRLVRQALDFQRGQRNPGARQPFRRHFHAQIARQHRLDRHLVPVAVAVLRLVAQRPMRPVQARLHGIRRRMRLAPLQRESAHHRRPGQVHLEPGRRSAAALPPRVPPSVHRQLRSVPLRRIRGRHRPVHHLRNRQPVGLHRRAARRPRQRARGPGRPQDFSTVWKIFFHSVEKWINFFPQCGKISEGFSMVWNSRVPSPSQQAPGEREVYSAAPRRGERGSGGDRSGKNLRKFFHSVENFRFAPHAVRPHPP